MNRRDKQARPGRPALSHRPFDERNVLIFLHGFFLLYTAVRAVRTPSFHTAAWFGAMLGLSLYVYATNQVLAVFVLLASIFYFGQRAYRRTAASVCGGLVSGAFVTALPHLLYNIPRGILLPIRSATSGGLYEPTRLNEVLDKTALFLHELFIETRDPWYSMAHGAITEPMFLFSLIGIVWLFRKEIAFETKYFKLVSALCLVLGAIPSIMTPEAPFRRASLFYVGLVLFAAEGFRRMARYLSARMPLLASRPIIATLAAGLVVFSVYRAAFEVLPSESISGRSFVSIARYLRSSPPNPDTKIYISDASFESDAMALDRFIWFNVMSPAGVTRWESNVLPDLYVGPEKCTAFLKSRPGATIIVPYFFLDEFRSLISNLPARDVPVQTLSVSDRLGELYFVFTRGR